MMASVGRERWVVDTYGGVEVLLASRHWLGVIWLLSRLFDGASL